MIKQMILETETFESEFVDLPSPTQPTFVQRRNADQEHIHVCSSANDVTMTSLDGRQQIISAEL